MTFTDAILHAFTLLCSGDPVTYSAIWATLQASGLSMFMALLIGIPLGFMLGYHTFFGKTAIRTLVNTLLALPTVIIGLLVYLLISNSGPLGGFNLLFSIKGIAIGQFILSLPIIVALTASAIEQQEKDLRMTLMTFGANRMQMAKTILWESKIAISAATVTAFGRVVSEVGISMMVGGNIKWHTRTMTTAITLETGKGEFAEGIALGIILLSIALIINIINTALVKGKQTHVV